MVRDGHYMCVTSANSYCTNDNCCSAFISQTCIILYNIVCTSELTKILSEVHQPMHYYLSWVASPPDAKPND